MTEPLDRIMKTADRPPLVMVKGAGSWLWDRDGKRYLDFVQGWAVNSLGHSPRVVFDALQAQGGRLINCSPAYYNEPMAKLAELLAEASGLDQVFLCNSGAEANEGAIKLARHSTGRPAIQCRAMATSSPICRWRSAWRRCRCP